MQKKVIQIFTKSLILGQVKTRLAESIGSFKALEIYKCLLRTTLQNIRNSEVTTTELWITGASAPEIVLWQQSFGLELQLRKQKGIDLGQKLQYAITTGLLNSDCVLVLGGDCATVTPKQIDEAFECLKKGFDSVFMPAMDGGFLLYATCCYQPYLFEAIDWSSAAILEQILRRFDASKAIYLLPPQRDVDVFEDLLAVIEHQVLPDEVCDWIYRILMTEFDGLSNLPLQFQCTPSA